MYEKAHSPPSTMIRSAIAQAMDCLLKTPVIRPFFPANKAIERSLDAGNFPSRPQTVYRLATGGWLAWQNTTAGSGGEGAGARGEVGNVL
jgi:hypothetical protein